MLPVTSLSSLPEPSSNPFFPSRKVKGLGRIMSSEFSKISLIVGISVGGKNHEDQSLSALVDGINAIHEQAEANPRIKSKITSCSINVCDTLQRQNCGLDGTMNDDERLAESKKAGEEWIKDNTPILNRLKVKYTVEDWEKWRLDDKYGDARKLVDELFKNDPEFQAAMETSIKDVSVRFIERHKKKNLESASAKPPSLDESLVADRTCQYLLEEIAVIMVMWSKEEKDCKKIVLYPAKMTPALAYGYNKLVPNQKQFKWQKFSFKSLPDSSKTLSAHKEDELPSNSLSLQRQSESVVDPINDEERRLHLIVKTICGTIMQNSNYSQSEKMTMLSEYTCKVSEKMTMLSKYTCKVKSFFKEEALCMDSPSSTQATAARYERGVSV